MPEIVRLARLSLTVELASAIGCGKGTASEAAEKLFGGVRSSPQALKRDYIFSSLAARLEVVPFPSPGESDFFRNL
jgi:hypothetical protein